MTQTLAITLFVADTELGIPTTRITKGSRHTLSWPELAAELTGEPTLNTVDCSAAANPRDRDPKFWGPAISFATFAGDERSDANVETCCAAGVDLDYDNAAQVSEAIERAKSLGLSFCWYGSWKPGRARLVFPYVRAATAAEHRVLYAQIVAALGVESDPTSCNPSRIHFAPQVPSQARMHEHISGVHDVGVFLGTTALASTPAGSVFSGVQLASERVNEFETEVA